jgi:hypothetical protein
MVAIPRYFEEVTGTVLILIKYEDVSDI